MEADCLLGDDSPGISLAQALNHAVSHENDDIRELIRFLVRSSVPHEAILNLPEEGDDDAASGFRQAWRIWAQRELNVFQAQDSAREQELRLQQTVRDARGLVSDDNWIFDGLSGVVEPLDPEFRPDYGSQTDDDEDMIHDTDHEAGDDEWAGTPEDVKSETAGAVPVTAIPPHLTPKQIEEGQIAHRLESQGLLHQVDVKAPPLPQPDGPPPNWGH